ncbi:MAG: hypothetical protein WBE11_18760 [Candidatus Aminicenantaceae bacterium]
MRKKKPIVWFSMIFILNLTVIFSGAEQDKLIRKVTNRSIKDINSIKEYFLPQQQYAPGESIVRFKVPLSDFEVAYLIGEFQLKIIGASRMANGCYLIRFQENCSVEHMVQALERNPYVEYAELNGIGHITANSSTQMIPNPSWEYGKLKPIKEVRAEGLHTDIEKAPSADGARQSYQALKKEDMLQKGIHSETKKTQSSDNKSSIRSKAKIYKYRYSEGRLVITNYSLSKSDTKKK